MNIEVLTKLNMETKKQIEERIKKNINLFGKNFPWKAWLPENVSEIPFTQPKKKNKSVNSYTGDILDNEETDKEPKYTCTGKPKTVFSGRFVAVSGFIYAIVNGKYSILANLRGPGTPDYQGCWNAPCGFLECFETSKEGIQREILEECGFIVDTEDLNVIHIETEPEECNNGNVTIRHKAFLGKINPKYVEREGGEANEVDGIKWIPLEEIDNYKWAFNHRKTVELYAPSKFMRKLTEIFYKYFLPYNEKY